MCLRNGLLTAEDIADQEAFLYIGLPALTLLEGVFRSLPLQGKMAMAAGIIVDDATCPPEFLSLYHALREVKAALLSAGLSPQEEQALRAVVLYSSDADKPNPLERVPADRCAVLNRLAASVQSVSISVTQLPFFKGRFNDILALLHTVEIA